MFGEMTKYLFENWFVTDEAHELMRRRGDYHLDDDFPCRDSLRSRRKEAALCSGFIMSAMSDRDCCFFRGEENPIEQNQVKIDSEGRVETRDLGMLIPDAPARDLELSCTANQDAGIAWESFKEWLHDWYYHVNCQKDFLTAMLYVRSLPIKGKVIRKEETVFALRMKGPEGETLLPFTYKKSAEAETDIERVAGRLVPHGWRGRCQIVIKDKSARISRIEKPEYDHYNSHSDRILEVCKLSIPAASGVSPNGGPHFPVLDWDVVRTKDKDGLRLSAEQWLERLDARQWGSEAAADAAEKCDWWKIDLGGLSQDQWVRVLRYRPELLEKCPCVNEFYDEQWCAILRRQPQFVDRFERLDQMGPWLWCFLLRRQPRFADRFHGWDDFDSSLWDRLLKDQPQFIEKCDLAKADEHTWSKIVKYFPEYAEKCPWDKFDGSLWCELLIECPEYANRCAWEKLEGGLWASLLQRRPEFASRCDWGKLSGYDWEQLLVHDPKYVENCDVEKLGLDARFHLLETHPELSGSIADWDEFSETQRLRLLKKSALFCERVTWGALQREQRIDYLLLRPEFQDKMNWGDVTDEKDWFRLLSAFPEYRKYAAGREGAKGRSYVWIGKSGPIVVVPVHNWFKRDVKGYPFDVEDRAENYCRGQHANYDEAVSLVDRLFTKHTVSNVSALALDGIYAGAEGTEGSGNFARIMKAWFAENESSIKLLYLECGSWYATTDLEG